MAEPNPGLMQAPENGRKGKWIAISLITFLVLGLAFWNYTTFAGGLFSADTDSPDCIKVVGTVTDIHASVGSARKARETYYISYDYQVEGKTYSEKEQVTYNIYNRTRLHDDIEVCYMKDHPSRSGVVGNDIKGETAFIVIIADIVFLVLAFIIIRSAIKQRRKAAVA
jgi:hypothetical protein